MRRKGFTLVELLAVIVILAVIAIIAVPIISGIVERSRKSSAESSALGYIDAVEKQIARNLLDSDNTNNITDGTYSISDLDSKNVRVNGDKPSEGCITITNGKVENYSLKINNYVVNIENGKAVATKNGEINTCSSGREYEVGEAINYNPTTNQSCSNPVSTTETKTGCMKWYVIKDNGTSIDVILDHNTTAGIRWYEKNDNIAYEDSNIPAALAADTTGWASGLNPRLITADEVNTIVGGVSTWDVNDTGTWFYFEGTGTKNQTIPTYNSSKRSSYDWLYNNLSNCKTDSTDYGCTIEDNNTYTGLYSDGRIWAYWTSTKTSYGYLWVVGSEGKLREDVASRSNNGIRPVITISKSNIS